MIESARPIIIVDSHDQPIGVKKRSLVTYDDIYRVSGLWLTNLKGDILLAQRGLHKKNDPGKWGPAVSGTVEASETYESNIYKEAAEEIGLHGVSFAIGPKIFVNDGQHRFFIQTFSATVDLPLAAFTPEPIQVAQLAWFPRSQLLRELKAEPAKFVPSANRWHELVLNDS
jgi:isopentenyldiphosphate isomerase